MVKLPIALTALVLLLLAFFLYREQSQHVAVIPNTYQNSTYQVVFSYPDSYVLSEHGLTETDNGHYSITLVRIEDAKPVENGEGPTGVSVDVYPYTGALLDWVRGTTASNFALSDGTYTATKVGNADAVSYHWSGLYEGETTAFIRGDYVVAVSVTRQTPGEHTDAYKTVLDSLGE